MDDNSMSVNANGDGRVDSISDKSEMLHASCRFRSRFEEEL